MPDQIQSMIDLRNIAAHIFGSYETGDIWMSAPNALIDGRMPLELFNEGEEKGAEAAIRLVSQVKSVTLDF